MKKKIFIDGNSGTTGLKIFDRIAELGDVELLKIPEEKRKDINTKKEFINNADIVFLCLPDVASIESAALCENPNTVIIDTSTAHRTNPEWAYGFPELSEEYKAKVLSSKRIAVPGCYATSFIALVYPLIKVGVLSPDYPLSANSVSGYSGAGKNGIAEYENSPAREYSAPRAYALSQNHKHLPEMKTISGLSETPIFNPLVDDYFAGILTEIPLFGRLLSKKSTRDELITLYKEHYKTSSSIIINENPEPFLSACELAETDDLEISVTASEDSSRILLLSRIDNLGKGASGAAIQLAKMKLAQ